MCFLNYAATDAKRDGAQRNRACLADSACAKKSLLTDWIMFFLNYAATAAKRDGAQRNRACLADSSCAKKSLPGLPIIVPLTYL